MPRFCANLTFLFPELPFLDRFAAARAAGFEAVEVLFPYDLPAPQILDRLDRTGLRLALINGPPPNYADGPRGFAAVPETRDRFRADFRRAARYAATLGAERLHLMAGVAEGPEARATYVENLAWAAAAAPSLPLTIEPINPHDMPGYFLQDFALAAEVIAEVGAPNLRLQFDAYHAHRITGDVLATWAAVAPLVTHVQVAGHPGRHEPDTGEIDLRSFLARLDADGYRGWVSAEYHPRGATLDGLGWMRA
ncbi:hydroxypyruvate isomerase family protein [Rubellimicrobium aerolatum]|uniref:Hydroxypyruvate isomerase family protein n=1 Tax=Rubellimicrobium aerolatum TaxID=490979 RepID=A0ABW0SAQ4_9RHOB|nr:TIM barrel protein [Rubellimicrobium aerolatum]MBP1806090.1 hydroxypyruvate isomerase [Rubellimicrobium aerolatum]